MSKATKILNYYDYKEILLHGNPQFENFRNSELIQFGKIAKKLLDNKEQKSNMILNEITNFCSCCSSKENCPENECILYRIEKIISEEI